MGGVEEGPHAAAGYPPNGHANGVEEEKLRRQLGKADGDPLRVVGIGAEAWGSIFCALLQDAYGHLRDKVRVRIWCRPGRAVDRATAEHLIEVINAREDVLRRLIRRCAYLKYVWDADIVINGLPSTEASLDPVPRIITPTQMISNASMVTALTNESATSNRRLGGHRWAGWHHRSWTVPWLDGTTVLGPCHCRGR